MVQSPFACVCNSSGSAQSGRLHSNHSDHSFIGSRCRQRVKPLGRTCSGPSFRCCCCSLKARLESLSTRSDDCRDRAAMCASAAIEFGIHELKDTGCAPSMERRPSPSIRASGENQKTSCSGRAGAPRTSATSQLLPCEQVCSERRGSGSVKIQPKSVGKNAQ
jgi:hypothetical protein